MRTWKVNISRLFLFHSLWLLLYSVLAVLKMANGKLVSGAGLKHYLTGHSHPSGFTGELFNDLSTITTALNIADSIIVYMGKRK